ncbi:MAG TPA: hypothetical protein VNL18_12955 [Gemmatimonadales bacterium]|nr:hypothetical protein [Gemmatimonadales bacterium]
MPDDELLRRSLTLTPGDVAALRNAGLTDREIAELALRSAFARARLGRQGQPAAAAGGESHEPKTQGDAP